MVQTSQSPLTTQLRDEIEYGGKGMFRKYLLRDKKQLVMLICLQAGIQISEHTSSYNGFITVIEGRGTFLLAGQEVILEPGVFIELPANTLHALTITENLAMLKIVSNHEPQEPQAVIKKASCPEKSRKHQPNQTTCAESLAELLKPYLQNSTLAELTVNEMLKNGVDP